MFGRIIAASIAVALGIRSAPAPAGTVCPDSSYVFATFDCNYSGNYKPGQPYDYITIWPFGQSDALQESGITIHVLLKDCAGAPLSGILPKMRNDSLCVCQNFGLADAPTDANGRTRFTRSMAGKGWATRLFVYADNVLVGSVRVKVNGPGPASDSDTNCGTDAFDLASFAAAYGTKNGVNASYTIRQDFNEDGYVDVVDWVLWNERAHLGVLACPPDPEVQP